VTPSARPETRPGLASLRRGGTLAELLFLYDCATEEVGRLKPVADRLGVTVQAVSHTYRRLARRGLVGVQDGRYRPTIAGIAWLHRVLGGLSEDVFGRQQRLHIIRSCRAVAGKALREGEPVSLDLVGGVLTAFPGETGDSRGRAAAAADPGSLVEVRELEGILRLEPAEVRILTVPTADLADPALPRQLARAVADSHPQLLLAQGLEADHLLRKAGIGPAIRFAVGPTCREAARVGVRCSVVVLDEELPLLVAQFSGPDAPRLSVRSLRGLPDRRGRRDRRAKRRE
jgi:predicted transcriptional regulator